LERWPLDLFRRVLPRHLQLIDFVDRQFMASPEVAGADVNVHELTSVDYSNGGYIRMGNLAFIGSHRVNGVSALHTELMKQTVFKGLHTVYPERIVNLTNGVTPRRWL